MDWVIKRNWSLVLSFNIYCNSQCAERSLLEGVYTWNVSYCLHVFAEMKFHPRDRDEISSRDGKKKKWRVNTSSQDEILKWAFFFSIFDVFFQICFPKLMCLNIMRVWKGWGRQVKNQKCKNIFIISINFFVRFMPFSIISYY